MLAEESGKSKRTGKMKPVSSCFDSFSWVFQHILLNLLGSEMLKSLYRRSSAWHCHQRIEAELLHTESVLTASLRLLQAAHR